MWEELFEEINGELFQGECLHSLEKLKVVLDTIDELKAQLIVTTLENIKE